MRGSRHRRAIGSSVDPERLAEVCDLRRGRELLVSTDPMARFHRSAYWLFFAAFARSVDGGTMPFRRRYTAIVPYISLPWVFVPVRARPFATWFSPALPSA